MSCDSPMPAAAGSYAPSRRNSSCEAEADGAGPAISSIAVGTRSAASINADAPAADKKACGDTLPRVPAAALALLCAGPAALVPAQDLPVITFTYETAQGIEEDDEEELEPTYVRHTLLTSVRQDLGDAARLTLPVRLTSRSDPREPAEGATQAVTVQPRFDFDLTDRLALGTELIVRRSEDPPLITAGGRLQSRLKVGEVALDGWLKPLFDLYAEQPERNRQLYTASLGITYTGGGLRISTRYRGTARFAFGEESEVDPRLSHLLTVSLRIDLNAVR